MPSADDQLLEIYKGEFAPPTGWDLSKARAYRQQLNGVKTGKLARYAFVGRMPFIVDMRNSLRKDLLKQSSLLGGSTNAPEVLEVKKRLADLELMIPDSFPFIQFSSEIVDDTELLKRGTLIRNAMNKYDPYSTDAWEPIVLQTGRGDKVSYDKLKFVENLAPEGPRPKDPVVQYLKSLPPTPGPKMRIKSDAKSFQAAKYSPDTLFEWTNGEITGNQTMLEIHHAIKRAAGDYLLTLYEEHQNRMIETMKLIDYEIHQNVRLGTEGRYVNRYSMRNALAALKQTPKGPDKVSLLLKNQIELEDDDYELFNPVIDVDNKGFQKWRKYADNKRKKYNYFMSVLSKSVVNTDTTKKDMKDYSALNADASARRAAIDAIQRVKAARAAPATVAASTSVSNAATIQAQNDAVDQFISDVKAMTSKADLNQYLSIIGAIDTSLLPNQQDRDNDMGQAVRDKEAELNAQPPPPPDYTNMSLDEVSKLSEQDIGKNFTVQMLRKLLDYVGPKGSKDPDKAFTNKKFFLKADLIKKVKEQEKFSPAKAAEDKRRADIYDTWNGQVCARITLGGGYQSGQYDERLVKISNLNPTSGTIDIELILTSIADQAMTDKDVDVKYLTPLTVADCKSENKRIQQELDRQKKFLKQKAAEANVKFGVLKKEKALKFLEDNRPYLVTPSNEDIRLDWFDVSTNADEHYDATLYYKTIGGDVVQLVIACVEGPPDVIVGESTATMELIEIHNYNKTKAGSIRPFVVKVLEEAIYSGITTVYLSPASENLEQMYKDSWGMESLGSKDGDIWMKADKSQLITNLGKSAGEIRVEVENKRLNALQKLTVQKGSGNWYQLQKDGITVFYASGASRNKQVRDLKGNLPDNRHVIQIQLVESEALGSQQVLKIDGTEYVMKTSDKNIISSDDNQLMVTKYAGETLDNVSDALDNLSEIQRQAVEGLSALHANGIVHQDIRLKNMAWDGTNLTLIDLSKASLISDACKASFYGDMNILPPEGLGDAKFGDKWSLVLALLDLGRKMSAVKSLLFDAEALKNKDGKCVVLKSSKQQSGLMFKSNEASNVAHRKKRITEAINNNDENLFIGLWMIWSTKEDIQSKTLQRGLIPGYGNKGNAAMSGLSINADNPKDDHNYMNELVSRMSGGNIQFAKAWIDGNLRLQKVQNIINKEVALVTKNKLLEPNTGEKQYNDITLGDLGKFIYGIPTDEVEKLFELIGDRNEALNFSRVASVPRSTFLDLNYDSYSDAELDEFEAALEPYDEEELDKLMEGALTGMAKEAYDSSSDGSNAISYDSSSDTGLSGTALSYDSSSDGGVSGAAHSYNSESEQSFHGSEHGASYDSDSDEDS